jgi:hypothetical protein
MNRRALARILALALAVTGPPAWAAGMPPYGTKNFTPAPGTPSYFTGERGLAYPAPPAPAATLSRPPAAAGEPAFGRRAAAARSRRGRTVRTRASRRTRLHRPRTVRPRRKPVRPRRKPVRPRR